MKFTPRAYQQEAHDAVIDWFKTTTSPCLVEAATGCHEYGHPILMADGTIKPVQDVAVGDYVMGADSTPREVLELHRGEQEMFKITPVKGEPFIVNGGHILSLYGTPRKKGNKPSYTELSVFEYLKKNDYFKHIHKLERCSVSFDSKDVAVPPYILGLLIGDASLTNNMISFSNENLNIILEVERWAESIGCSFNYRYIDNKNCYQGNITDYRSGRKVKNRATVILSKYGLMEKKAGDKYIPFEYLANSVEARLEIIAGLLDTDGSYDKGGYDWISKSERLADDMVYLCRSVGLAAYKKEATKKCQTMQGLYYRVFISGDCSIIPLKVGSKKSKVRGQIKRVNVTGFKVDPVGVGEYYGFTITGDHLYLDGYFVRHHNSGKSVIVSMIAETLHELSGGKRVLCLAPSADLVLQNAEKFETTGYPFSIYSASAGQKSLRHPVIFATPLTFKKVARRLANEFTGVVIDECHGITKTIKEIIEEMRSGNPNLRVCGLTATPYRLGDGLVFAEDHKGNTISEHQARDPYFAKQVYEIGAKYLINQGFLTPPLVGCINAERYDTSGLVVQSNGSFSSKSVDQAFVGWGRKTAAIVADVVSQSQDRDGVMIFAATVDHAKEVLASLPPDLSRMIGGDVNTKKDDRRRLVNDFKARKFKYLVSVGTMTTGVDFIHVSVIAVLRRTESVSLFQQIIGRGMRLCDGKDNFLLLDYAGNIEALCPDGDLFAPEIKAAYHSEGKTFIDAECEECGAVNKFSSRENPDDLDIDANGYFLDIDGDRIESEYGFVPAHYGRRCCGMVKSGHEYVRCSHYWTSKECPTCQHMNDITARRCESCRTELINPNDKLIADFKIQKRDPSMLQTDELLQMEVIPTVSRAGNKMVRVEMMTTERSFDVFLMPEHANDWVRSKHDKFYEVTDGYTVKPRTVTYKKEESGMYDIKDYNLPSDKEQLKQELLKGGYTGEI